MKNTYAIQREVARTLEALTEMTRTGEGNLLQYAVDAARARATIGEISDAVERYPVDVGR